MYHNSDNFSVKKCSQNTKTTQEFCTSESFRKLWISQKSPIVTVILTSNISIHFSNLSFLFPSWRIHKIISIAEISQIFPHCVRFFPLTGKLDSEVKFQKTERGKKCCITYWACDNAAISMLLASPPSPPSLSTSWSMRRQWKILRLPSIPTSAVAGQRNWLPL